MGDASEGPLHRTAERSDVFPLPSEGSDPGLSLADGFVSGLTAPGADAAHARRISYFMLFRLAVLITFTVLAAFARYVLRGVETDSIFNAITWGSLGLGYALTLLYAWLLRRVRQLDSFAWAQTTTDIVLAAVVVQLTGGVGSGFVFLYLVAILGAAIMGNRQQTLAATGACVLIFGTLAALQAGGFVTPVTLTGEVPRVDVADLGLSVARGLAAMAGVGTLSVYLNTQLVSSARELTSLRALNENIVRSLSSGLITIDADGQILYANPTAEALVASSTDLAGRSVEELLPGVMAELDDSGGPEHRFQISPIRADGKRIDLELNCCPLLDESGLFLGYIVHFQDVTELRDLERQVRRNERLAAVGSLAATVAHEVRNPLAAISGSAELLQTGELTSEDARLLAVIHRESVRLNQKVTALLAFTRPQRPQLVAVDIARTTRDVVEAFRSAPENRELDVRLELEPPAIARADPGQVAQVLWNLLRNAGEALQGRGRIDVSVSTRANRVHLDIEDDGPGIPRGEQDRIFEPFFTTKAKGSGFGLALVHRMVEDHGGSISLRSEPGEGTCFQIRLPRADAKTER